MEKDSLKGSNHGTPALPSRAGGADGLLRSSSEAVRQTTSSDFVLQWGNRKRLRCMKVQVKDDSAAPAQRTTARVDRRVVRADRDPIQPGTTNTNHSNGYLNLRHRPYSPPMPAPQRVLRERSSPIIVLLRTSISGQRLELVLQVGKTGTYCRAPFLGENGDGEGREMRLGE